MTTEDRGPTGAAREGSLSGPRIRRSRPAGARRRPPRLRAGHPAGRRLHRHRSRRHPACRGGRPAGACARSSRAHDASPGRGSRRAGGRGGARLPLADGRARGRSRWSGMPSRSTASRSDRSTSRPRVYPRQPGIFLPLAARILGSRELVRDVIGGRWDRHRHLLRIHRVPGRPAAGRYPGPLL